MQTLGVHWGGSQVTAGVLGLDRWQLRGGGHAAVLVDRHRAVAVPPTAASARPDRVAARIASVLGRPDQAAVVAAQQLRPEVLAAVLLRQAVRQPTGAPATGAPAMGAAVCVPAGYDAVARVALRDAAALAGLAEVTLLSDTAAVAAAWLLDRDAHHGDSRDGLALLVDLGADHCDAAVLQVQGSQATVEARSCDSWGGHQWDDLVIEELAREVERHAGATPLDPLTGAKWRRQTAHLAESLRLRLDRREVADWECPFRDQLVRGYLTRPRLEQLTRPLLERLEAQVEALAADRVFDWLLLGGRGGRMPSARQRLERLAGRRAIDRSDPQLAARGAAALVGSGEGATAVEVVDQAASSLGVQTTDKRTKRAVSKVVLRREATLPCQRTLKLRGGESLVQVKLLQGESELAEENRFIGECRIGPELHRGEAVQLAIGYAADGQVAAGLLRKEGPLEMAIEHPDHLSAAQRRRAALWLSRHA